MAQDNVTLVTALYDIGRSKLVKPFTRSIESYQKNFIDILRLKSPLVIYTEEKFVPFIWKHRKKHNTKVIVYNLKDFIYYSAVQKIRSTKWKNQATWLSHSPQAALSLYNPLVMSKMYWLDQQAQSNPFSTHKFCWIDAGISKHVDKKYFSNTFVKHITKYLDDFLFLCYPRNHNESQVHGFPTSELQKVCKSPVDFVARGGFFGGNAQDIASLYTLYDTHLKTSLQKGYMGTEESIFTLLIHKYPKKVSCFYLPTHDTTSFFSTVARTRNKRKKNKVLVTLADQHYVDQAKQLFSSAYFTSGWSGDYVLLAYNIKQSDLTWFRDRGIIVKSCPDIDKTVSALPSARSSWKFDYPYMILSKFYLFTSFFKKWDHVLFLDADIIIQNSLENFPLDRTFNAAFDVANPTLYHQFIPDVHKTVFTKLDQRHNLSKKAFNAGVFSFPTNIIKKHTFDQLCNLYQLYGALTPFHEQAILNLYFKDWKEIPQAYNLHPGGIAKLFYSYFQKISTKGIILHFMGEQKPWYSAHPQYMEWCTNLKNSSLISDRLYIAGYQPWKTSTLLFYSTLFRLLPVSDRIIGKLGRVRSYLYYALFYLSKLKKRHVDSRYLSVVITSAGRKDYLEKTIESLRKYLKYDRSKIKWYIIDDFPDKETRDYITQLNFDVTLFNAKNRGIGYSTNRIYSKISSTYVFHCEDDWEFIRPIPIEKMMGLLEKEKYLGQLVLGWQTYWKQPQFLTNPKNDTAQFSESFSANPNLQKYEVFIRCAPLGLHQSEISYTRKVRKKGYTTRILGYDKKDVYVIHLGEKRQVTKY